MERQNNPVLGQQPTNLIAELRPAADQPATNAMQRLQVLLLDRFLSYESHLWTAHCFADRRRITRIVLLPSEKSFYELRCNQADVVPERTDHARPIVRAPRGLQPDQTRWDAAEELGDLACLESPRKAAGVVAPVLASRAAW